MDSALGVVLVIVCIVLLFGMWQAKQQAVEQCASRTAEAQKTLAELARLNAKIESEAQDRFRKWRQVELDQIRREETETARRKAELDLKAWKVTAEESIRGDAIRKSRSVTVGKAAEHVLPFLPEFTYNPKDARFLGSPVDFVVFDGLDAGKLEKVVFVEVKTGSSTLSTRERMIRDAVTSAKVEWSEVRIPTERVGRDERPKSPQAGAESCGKPNPAEPRECRTTIVSCPACARMNRVRVDSTNVRCGACKNQLSLVGV